MKKRPGLAQFFLKKTVVSKSTGCLRSVTEMRFNIVVSTIPNGGWPPKLHGFICAYHTAAPGSNPKHSIDPFSICN